MLQNYVYNITQDEICMNIKTVLSIYRAFNTGYPKEVGIVDGRSRKIVTFPFCMFGLFNFL